MQQLWTVVWKEKDQPPKAFGYTDQARAERAKRMLDDSDGGELLDENGKYAGVLSLEWVYLIEGKLADFS